MASSLPWSMIFTKIAATIPPKCFFHFLKFRFTLCLAPTNRMWQKWYNVALKSGTQKILQFPLLPSCNPATMMWRSQISLLEKERLLGKSGLANNQHLLPSIAVRLSWTIWTLVTSVLYVFITVSQSLAHHECYLCECWMTCLFSSQVFKLSNHAWRAMLKETHVQPDLKQLAKS